MHDNEVEETTHEPYSPDDLTIGTAYVRYMGADDRLALGGTVYHLPIKDNYLGIFLAAAIRDAGLDRAKIISEDEFGNNYLWIIGG